MCEQHLEHRSAFQRFTKPTHSTSLGTPMDKMMDAVQRFRKIEEATAPKDDPAPGEGTRVHEERVPLWRTQAGQPRRGL